jgi:hypothetical protein
MKPFSQTPERMQSFYSFATVASRGRAIRHRQRRILASHAAHKLTQRRGEKKGEGMAMYANPKKRKVKKIAKKTKLQTC